MDAEEEDLCLLTALLEENEAASGGDPHGGPDTFDELFDADGDGESYTEAVEDEEGGDPEDQKENVAALFGDVGDLTDEEEDAPPQLSAYNTPPPGKTHQELQDELRKLQEQMKTLQEQLQMATIAKPAQPLPPRSRDQGDSAPRPPLKEKKLRRIQESTCFSAELDVPAPPRAKRVARTPKVDPKTPTEPKSSPSGSTVAPTRPLQSTPGNEPGRGVRGQRTEAPGSPGAAAEPVSVEAFSGLRLRRPRVSSTEMNKKMVGRKLVRLSQLQEKLATEKLDEIDWVTFGVILKKVTPQSCNSGKTFSIWRLNDLRDLTRHVSLFLFGDVHRQLWKTAEGSVVGLLNANPMKPRDGSEEVCLSIDHPQKVLVMGEALDLGTCRAKKKNGEPCTQTVNLRDCEYCQYHIQAQYKRLSAKRPDLQSSFSGGRVPKKFARRGASLKERLCQDGFYYGGVSSASYAASLAPKKKIQTTLSHLVVRGSDQVLQETQRKLGMPQKSLSCSEEFKELMDLPTFGARNLKQHLAKATAGATGLLRPAVQSISASALLKQQKQQMLEMRKKRAEEIQKRSLQSASQLRDPAVPPPSPPSPPGTPHAGPQLPRLGRGIAEGDDILFYDESPPPKPQLGALAEAKKLAAITKLRAKGQILTKTNPNTIKKKPKDPRAVLEVKGRVEKSISGPAPAEEDLEPARKRRKEQQAYLESEEFQKILKAKSRHTGIVKEAEAELQERYFEPLVKKEQLEEKMRSTRSVKCRVVTCRTCAYTHFQPRETCVSEQHNLRWHEAVKSFFRCPCGNRTISLDRLPKKHCSNCGLFKWERDGMLKEKTGPKIGGETLLPRGEEHAKFLNSLK